MLVAEVAMTGLPIEVHLPTEATQPSADNLLAAGSVTGATEPVPDGAPMFVITAVGPTHPRILHRCRYRSCGRPTLKWEPTAPSLLNS